MRNLLAVLACVLGLGAAPLARAQATGVEASPARHVAIMDGESGILLYCRECDAPMPPASMSKLMTVLIALERIQAGQLSLDAKFPVSENAWRHGAMSDGSHMFLELGAQVSVRELLRGIVIVSANDACVALAEGVAGSEDAFVVEMNKRARELGLASAHFRNVTGLPDPDHVISAADLARLARHLIYDFPDFYATYSEPSFTYNNRTQENRNPLLGAFTGADGVKTGHTTASGYGMIGSAQINGARRIIVFNGVSSMAERRSEAQRLMSAAFHDFGVLRLAKAGDTLGEADVWLGSRRTVALVAKQDIIIGGSRANLAGLSADLVYQGPLRAPLREGDPAGRLVVEGPQFRAQEFPLVIGKSVGRANPFARAWAGLQLTLSGR